MRVSLEEDLGVNDRVANLFVSVVLQGEIETCMKLLGVKDVSGLGPRFVSFHLLEQLFSFPLTPVSRSTAEWSRGISLMVTPVLTREACGLQHQSCR